MINYLNSASFFIHLSSKTKTKNPKTIILDALALVADLLLSQRYKRFWLLYSGDSILNDQIECDLTMAFQGD